MIKLGANPGTIRYGARELRVRKPTEEELAKIKRRPIYLILDNVLDTYNIGGLFRLADAVGAEKVILCGDSETPPSSRIHKAAVGTEEWVPWSYSSTAIEALQELKNKQSLALRAKNEKLKILAVEQSDKSIPYTEIENLKFKIENCPLMVVVGHETKGISKEVLSMADLIVKIPLFGANKSLNVIVSAGIVLFEIVRVISLLTKRS